ncbi:ZG16 protein, partial [Atractosteus spatula]|nr:ZG16 protein [Atractosteus spatula]
SNCFFRIQIKYGKRWSPVYGYPNGQVQELQLYQKEAIIQVFGRRDSHINQLIFSTNSGRSFIVGSSTGSVFNFYPVYHGAELRYITGSCNFDGISSFGVQWDRVVYGAPINTRLNVNLSSDLKAKDETNLNMIKEIHSGP